MAGVSLQSVAMRARLMMLVRSAGLLMVVAGCAWVAVWVVGVTFLVANAFQPPEEVQAAGWNLMVGLGTAWIAVRLRRVGRVGTSDWDER